MASVTHQYLKLCAHGAYLVPCVFSLWGKHLKSMKIKRKEIIINAKWQDMTNSYLPNGTIGQRM